MKAILSSKPVGNASETLDVLKKVTKTGIKHSTIRLNKGIEIELSASAEDLARLASEFNKTAIFINATAHNLLPRQLQKATEELNALVLSFREINPELFRKLTDIKDERYYELQLYADEFFDTINPYPNRMLTYVHLPIGSPDFQFVLYSRWTQDTTAVPVFSRTERKAVEVEKDGKVEKSQCLSLKTLSNRKFTKD